MATAVLWKVTPLFAEWLSSRTNPLHHHLLGPASTVLELGCGISPLNAFALAPFIGSYVLSDQHYVQKLLGQNIAANGDERARGKVTFRPLDWEEDEVTAALSEPAAWFDAVLAADCVYNYALVEPFVQTCAEACRLKERHNKKQKEEEEEETERANGKCVCIVAQQLRNSDVFRDWLESFMERFRVWRVKERLGAGFVVHVGVLKDEAASP